MGSIYDWSTTASDNGNSDSGIDWSEGQDPSTVNNSARATLGRIAEFLADISGTITAGGTANALTATANSSFTTYANGRMLSFIAASDNTAAATLSVNSIGAKSIRKRGTTGDEALASGDIQSGAIYTVQYNTALNSAAGGWLLISNPPSSGSLLASNNLSDVASATTSATNLGLGTGDSPQFTAVNVGHATDTTVARASSGVISVEGNHVPSPASQAQGDVLYHNGTTWARLAKGTAAQVLAMNSGATAPEWATASSGYPNDALEFLIDGGDAVITTGIKGDIEVPYACTIDRVTLLADQSGSIVVDVWKDSYANYPPTDADSITASAVPTISAATKDQDSTLTGWTTSLSAGDILRFNVDSASTVQRVLVSLKVTKT